jgi:prefoldin subunit 5
MSEVSDVFEDLRSAHEEIEELRTQIGMLQAKEEQLKRCLRQLRSLVDTFNGLVQGLVGDLLPEVA